MVSNIHWMFRPCTMTSSSCYSIDSVNHHITRRCNIQHDDLSVASSSRFIAVLHALPDSLILISSFQNNCTGNPLHETAKRTILYPCSLHWGLNTWRFSSHVPPQFSSHGTDSSIATNVFEWWETNTASGLRLVCTMVGKTNFLSRSILSSSHFPF